MSSIDAVIVADYGADSMSGSSPFKLTLNGHPATVQTIRALLRDDNPLPAQAVSWSSAFHYNGIVLLNHLLKRGYKAELINELKGQEEALRRLVLQKPRLIVVSTTFILDKRTLAAFLSEIRSISGDIPLVVGGPFVYSSMLVKQKRKHDPAYHNPAIAQQYLFADPETDPEADLYVVSPSGRETIIDAIEARKAGSSLARIQTARDPVSECDPIDWTSLPDTIFESGVVTASASSGCPYRCFFCNFVKDPDLTNAKPIDQIISEMRQMRSRGVRYVWFVDDIFRLGKGGLNEFSQRLIDENLLLKWMTFIRADTVQHADFELLKKAGCVELQLGLESADPEVLAAMNKKANPENYRKVLHNILAAGINVSAYFIFGHPGETAESASRTIAFIDQTQFPELPGALSWSFYPFILAPLAPVFDTGARAPYGLDGYFDTWRHNTMDSEEARDWIKKAFMTLSDSSPIYRDDDLDMLEQMSAQERKDFMRMRHQFAKQLVLKNMDEEEVIETFRQLTALRPKPAAGLESCA